VARAELVLALDVVRPVPLRPDLLQSFAAAVMDVRPGLGERAEVCIDLVPVIAAYAGRLRKRRMRAAEQAGGRTDGTGLAILRWGRDLVGEFAGDVSWRTSSGITSRKRAWGERDRGAELCRRRGLAIASAVVSEYGDVILKLGSGQTATVEPAAGRELDTLNLWDEFVLNVLIAEEERDLDGLDTDSCYGRFG
jgi:hypothetical protein